MQPAQTELVSCPWCGTRNAWGGYECRRCGGPLPAPALEDPGPVPPPPPRTVPQGYVFQQFIANATGIVGAIFLLVGLPFTIAFPIVALTTGEWFLLLIGGGVGGMFVGIGGLMFALGFRSVKRKAGVYRLGKAVAGTVMEVGVNHNLTVNGRNPWIVRYAYSVLGRNYEAYTQTWHSTVEPGSPLHVLYHPADPAESVVYPPLSGPKP